jgi:two-component system phosphate regulon sensor histidine kinase PhoR
LLADQSRRVYRVLIRQAQDNQDRLDEFLAAIQASPNGVLLLDSEGRIEWCNQTAADHLGVDPQRDLMQHVTNLVREPAFLSYLNVADFDQEVQINGYGASPAKPVQISVHIHPYGKKRRLMLTRDVTAVQQAEAMRRDFVANVSHEIRTPLTVLSGFVETLQSLPLNEAERLKYLALMAQQAERMQTLVNDLLMLSRLEGSPSPSRQDWSSARDLLGRCLQEAKGLSEVLNQSEHRIEMEFGADFELAGNAGELISGISNLLSNAVRYTPGGGRISCGIRRHSDGDAEVWVADTGPGISPEHIPRLTERFYRVDRSRSRETGGTGLGLAIVKHVIQRHGGQLSIASKLGQGSVFTLRFPADRIRAPVQP